MQLRQQLATFIWYQSGVEAAVAHCLKVFGAATYQAEIDLAALRRAYTG
jgi:hypothetical protein